MTIRRGTPADVPRALQIWRDAVAATHTFLSPADLRAIDAMVAEWLPTAELWIAEDEGRAAGFLVMDGTLIDALFVDPAVHGRGFGTALVQHALALAPGASVDVSEQAANALPFYLARGFVRTGRSETDGQGRPYPLIHMRHQAQAPQMTARATIRLAAIAALPLLAACQPEPQAQPDAAQPQASLTPAQQAFADANARMHAAMDDIPADPDEAFIRGMLAHHRGAVEMAELALRHGKDPEVRALAQEILDAQSAEIAQMESWLSERGLPSAPSPGHAAPHP